MTKKITLFWLAIVYLTLSSWPIAQAADETESLGIFKDWSAAAYVDGDRSGCYIVSKPKSEKGDYTRRGNVYALVSLSSSVRSGIISLAAGYPFREESEVNVDIDGKVYTLLTNDETAWAYQGEDSLFIERMKNGKRMVVIGFSKRGTKTTDTYSLFGFTLAYQAILDHPRCK